MGALVDDNNEGRARARVSGEEDPAGRQLMDIGDNNDEDDTGEGYGDESSGDGSCCDSESD